MEKSSIEGNRSKAKECTSMRQQHNSLVGELYWCDMRHLFIVTLLSQEGAKDLGIYTDGSLKFSRHINHIVAKAHARASLIHKCFLSKDRSILVKAYVTYVRPLLEYAVHVWSPYQLEDIARIESVQRRFTKRLSGLSNDNYSSRLATLDLKSLELRRLHQDLMYTYKIIFGLVDLDCYRFFTISSNETTRGHTCKLFVCHSRVDVRKYFLCNHVVKVWNSFPATSDDFTSIRSFSSLIKRTDLSRFVNF